MKKTAFIVNTARGPIIDEKALVRALKGKKIAGAGLDVFEFEPNVSAELRKMKNVVLNPHLGSAARSRCARRWRISSSTISRRCSRARAPPVNPERRKRA